MDKLRNSTLEALRPSHAQRSLNGRTFPRVAGNGWRVAGDGRRVVGGGWRVMGDGWRVAGDGGRVTGEY